MNTTYEIVEIKEGIGAKVIVRDIPTKEEADKIADRFGRAADKGTTYIVNWKGMGL